MQTINKLIMLSIAVSDMKKDFLIEGSAMLVQALRQADPIDEINLMVHSAIAGSKKRSCNGGTVMIRLELVESKTLSYGVALINYAPAK